MTIKGIVCDFGGVLVLNSETPVHQKWIRRMGMDYRKMMSAVFGSEVATQASIGAITEEEFWKAIQKQFGLSEKEGIEFSREIFSEERLNTD